MTFLTTIDWLHLIYALGLCLIGLLLSKKLSALTTKTLQGRLTKHQVMLTERLFYYVILIVFLFAALQQLGVKLAVVLGAAGVLTVALSFAAQTAASNLISGFFLLFEQPFKIGDTIEVKQHQGSVESIDFLSTKIKTSQGTLIRIPNEVLMKAEIINLSHYKTRRLEISFIISHETSFKTLQQILSKAISEEPLLVKKPPGEIILDAFLPNGLLIKIGVWVKANEASQVKQSLYELIKIHLDAANIQLGVKELS